jgi:hypothetical protein
VNMENNYDCSPGLVMRTVRERGFAVVVHYHTSLLVTRQTYTLYCHGFTDERETKVLLHMRVRDDGWSDVRYPRGILQPGQ